MLCSFSTPVDDNFCRILVKIHCWTDKKELISRWQMTVGLIFTFLLVLLKKKRSLELTDDWKSLLRETREGLGTCPSTPKPTCTRIIGSGGSCTWLSKFLIGGVWWYADDTQCFILLWTLCLSGFDFEQGKVSRRSDFTHCYTTH